MTLTSTTPTQTKGLMPAKTFRKNEMRNLLMSAAVALSASATTAQSYDLRADYTPSGYAGRQILGAMALAEPVRQIEEAAKKLGSDELAKIDCNNIDAAAPVTWVQYCTAFQDFLTVYFAQVKGEKVIASAVRNAPRTMCTIELDLQDALATYNHLEHYWQQEFPGEPMPVDAVKSVNALRLIVDGNKSACRGLRIAP